MSIVSLFDYKIDLIAQAPFAISIIHGLRLETVIITKSLLMWDNSPHFITHVKNMLIVKLFYPLL
jgi:hypothetical protein